ncbi:hypothetical protein [Pseudolysinimonas yzui]|uniref:Uncharacterized protein n=1 Tax=Pseudolysinimonas yzui TaxID=2708254 RepID=A0A8J3DZM0_9MICO|nr:hypothetical protein [Pseudolysinimonas yzui]GHF04638.1 hypothetical protein GCM10011600_01380 [Pseudolysinimonas yzui]
MSETLVASDTRVPVALLFAPPGTPHDARVDRWTAEVEQTMTKLFETRAATARQRGVVVVSCDAPVDVLRDADVMRPLRTLMRELGRDLELREVGFVLDGHYLGVTNFVLGES